MNGPREEEHPLRKWPAVVTACVAGGHLAVAWSSWQPWGASESTLMLANLGFALFACLVVLLGFGALMVALPALLAKRSRTTGSALAYGALIAVGLVALDVVLYSAIRDAGIRKLISRGDEIVAAIGSFERDQGRIPQSLEELVPKYLPTIPATDIAISPEFSYGPGYTFGEPRSWEIAVGLTQWILDDTRLLYHSDQKYGGCAYRYGPWALSSCG